MAAATSGILERFILKLGSVAMMGGASIRRLFTRFEWLETVYQVRQLGILSLSVALLTAVFAGLVMTIQFGYNMERFGATRYVGKVVSLAILRELGPVLTALMVGGRIGAGITAELGSMKVTEQIDAIRCLGADPIAKLVVPRVAAATIIMPLLTGLADVIGIFGGGLISQAEFDISLEFFYRTVVETIMISDFTSGLFKAAVFGFIISLVACHEGFHTEGGTEGVGLATTRTVVISSVSVLVADFILTKLMLAVF